MADEVRKDGPNLPSGRGLNRRPAGATGLNRVGGVIVEEFLRDLQGQNAIRVYKEMRENDSIIGAMFFAIEMFLRRVQWFVDPAEEGEEAEKQAQFLRECKDDMSHTWSDFTSEVLSMLEYGWSYFEILYKRRRTEKSPRKDYEAPSSFNDGKIGWRKFDIRSQDSLDRWEFDETDGGLQGMYQRPAPEYRERYVPIQKSLLFRTQARKNSPEGKSVLRNAYRSWYFKRRIEEIEGVGVERDLAGLPFAEVPAAMLRDDATEDDKATLQSIVELVKNVRRDEQEGVIWPQDWDDKGNKQYEFKLMNSGGTRQFSTDQIITRYEQRMAMSVLADFILLGNDSTGSYAMATSKSGMFQSALSAWLDVIQDVLNNYAVPRLFRLNNFDGPYPTFRHDEVQKPALADLATYVAALAGAGAQLFPDIDLENHFRRLAQLPLRQSEDENKGKEDELRQQKVEQEIAEATAAIDTAQQQPALQRQQMQNNNQLQRIQQMQQKQQQNNQKLGKQPGSRPGAPTKTTGRVKSKLPPQQRRRTASTRAAENVGKREEVEE